jgi:hypothetical protein
MRIGAVGEHDVVDLAADQTLFKVREILLQGVQIVGVIAIGVDVAARRDGLIQVGDECPRILDRIAEMSVQVEVGANYAMLAESLNRRDHLAAEGTKGAAGRGAGMMKAAGRAERDLLRMGHGVCDCVMETGVRVPHAVGKLRRPLKLVGFTKRTPTGEKRIDVLRRMGQQEFLPLKRRPVVMPYKMPVQTVARQEFQQQPRLLRTLGEVLGAVDGEHLLRAVKDVDYGIARIVHEVRCPCRRPILILPASRRSR